MNNTYMRFAVEEDAESILSIYGPYILDTVITFEYEIPSIIEFKQRIKNIIREYPFIVYVVDEKIVAYAYAHRQMERAAYQWNVELSVYVDMKYKRQGIGSKLYNVLIEILKLQNICNVYGCVTVPNDCSEGLHGSLGFEKIGIYHNTGYKFNSWHNVAWFEKNIAIKDAKPSPFKAINEVEDEELKKILSKYIDKSVTSY